MSVTKFHGIEHVQIDRYISLVHDLNVLVQKHSTNREVFGSKVSQEIVVSCAKDNRMVFHMRVSNVSMLNALNCKVAGIDAHGSLSIGGTVTTYHSIVDSFQERVNGVIDAMGEEGADLRSYWLDSVDEILAEGAAIILLDWRNYLSMVDVCSTLGVSSTTLNRYRKGILPPNMSPFPEPTRHKGRSPYWHSTAIAIWDSKCT